MTEKHLQEQAQILQPLGAWKKTKIAFFAIFPRRISNMRLRHFVIYVCTFLIAVEGQDIYIYRYTLSVREVIIASIVALLCGLVLIFTILDELDREDPLNALLKTDSEDESAADPSKEAKQ